MRSLHEAARPEHSFEPALSPPLLLSLEIGLRTCHRNDLKALEWHGLFAKDRKIIQRAFERHLRGENLMLLATLGGMVVGQVWLDFRKCEPHRVIYVWAVRVIPWLQGLGIGTYLLGAAEQLAGQRGSAALELTVHRSNTNARRLYERLGYSPVPSSEGRLPRQKRCEVRLRKKLDGPGAEGNPHPAVPCLAAVNPPVPRHPGRGARPDLSLEYPAERLE